MQSDLAGAYLYNKLERYIRESTMKTLKKLIRGSWIQLWMLIQVSIHAAVFWILFLRDVSSVFGNPAKTVQQWQTNRGLPANWPGFVKKHPNTVFMMSGEYVTTTDISGWNWATRRRSWNIHPMPEETQQLHKWNKVQREMHTGR